MILLLYLSGDNELIRQESGNQHGFNTLRPRLNGCHFANNTFRRIFLNKDVRILIKISLKFIPKGPVNNIPALVKINGLAPTRRQAII